MNRIAYGISVAALLFVGCHTITEELPTEPTPTKPKTGSGILTVSIPAIPTATPTPKPSPSPTPSPAATPTPSPTPGPTPSPTPDPTPEPTPPPNANGCGNPLPPPISKMGVKVHLRGPNRWTLDSTPIVHDRDYCTKVGFVGRIDCPVRPEGSPDRAACEAYAVGKARDTGRTGPTWTRNGKYCTGAANDCENHEENQYLLYAMGGGTYTACTKDDVCGSEEVDR